MGTIIGVKTSYDLRFPTSSTLSGSGVDMKLEAAERYLYKG